MIRVSIESNGFQRVRQTIARIPSQALPAATTALYREAEEIMGDAKEHYVPVDLGALKNSGHVQPPKTIGDETVIEMGFGGATAPYALYVHDRLDVKHRVGQAKFLEAPYLAALPRIVRSIAAAVRGALR